MLPLALIGIIFVKQSAVQQQNRSCTCIRFPFFLCKFFFPTWILSLPPVVPVPLKKQRTGQGKSSGSSSSAKPSVPCVYPHREDTDIKSHSKACLPSVNISPCKKHCHGIVQSCINSCNFCPSFWSLQLASRLLNCSVVKGRFKNFMHRHGMWCKLSCTWHLTHE